MTKRLHSSAGMLKLVLPETEFALLPAVKKMVDAMFLDVEEDDDDDGYSETDSLETYFRGMMENLSEAGYTEATPEDLLSIRAFANILRVKPDDLKAVKALTEYRRNACHDFAVSQTIAEALAYDHELVPALRLMSPDKDAQAKGPFYPHRKELDVLDAVQAAAAASSMTLSSYLRHVVNMPRAAETSRLTRIDGSVKKLAGMIRMNQWQLAKVADMLIEAGANDKETLGVRLAFVVLAGLRSLPRFVAGTRWVEPFGQ